MKTLKCKCGKDILVDDADHESASKYEWCCNGNSVMISLGYGSGAFCIARLIIDVPEGLVPDHIDRDYHNNQSANLRIATNSQNGANKGPQKNNTSGYKGVSWNSRTGRWCARITVDGEVIHLGSFVNIRDAATRYNKAARLHFGEFAYQNAL